MKPMRVFIAALALSACATAKPSFQDPSVPNYPISKVVVSVEDRRAAPERASEPDAFQSFINNVRLDVKGRTRLTRGPVEAVLRARGYTILWPDDTEYRSPDVLHL